LLEKKKEIGFARPKEGKAQGDLVMVFQYLGGSCKELEVLSTHGAW